MTSADGKSIEEICSATWKQLYRFVYFKVQNREEAEDITQETYVKAISYLQNGKVAPHQYIAFLRTVAHNLLRDGWRKKKRRGTVIHLDAVRPKELATEDPAETSVQRHLIEAAMLRLTPEQRTVIELRIIRGFSVADAAQAMNKQETAIRVMQHRALHALAAILNKHI